MLYFTREGFRRLANQNRGHIRVMLEFVVTGIGRNAPVVSTTI